MGGAITPLPQYAFMAWRSLKAQGKLYLLPFDRKSFEVAIIVEELVHAAQS
jgi:hypothetical protein